MLHFIGGEIIPRRVLCPWRAHLLDSTLPAVARATAACFVRGEYHPRALGASLSYLPTHHIAQAVAACADIAPVADTVGTLPKEVLVGVVSLGIPQ